MRHEREGEEEEEEDRESGRRVWESKVRDHSNELRQNNTPKLKLKPSSHQHKIQVHRELVSLGIRG